MPVERHASSPICKTECSAFVQWKALALHTVSLKLEGMAARRSCDETAPHPCACRILTLLIRVTTVQGDADYMQQLEAFVPALCRNAAPTANGAAANGAGGGSAAALQALRAHVALASRLSLSTRHLDAIESAALANLMRAPATNTGLPDAPTSHAVAAALMQDLGDAMQVRRRLLRVTEAPSAACL